MKAAHSEEDLIDQLIEVGETVVRRGLVLASGGNLSARLPGSDRYVITGTATWLDRLTPEDFSVVSMTGDVVGGGAAVPSSEWKLHHRAYEVRDDVNAIVHVHPQHAVLIDALAEPIRMVTLDHAVYVGSVGHVDYFPNGSDELADGAAKQALTHDAIVLAYHGCSSLGSDVGMAFRRAINLEEAAIATYRMLALGDKHTMFPVEYAAALHHA